MENWPRVTLDSRKEYTMCFGCGRDNPIGLKLKFDWDGKTARAEFTPNKNHQGRSGYVHGGILLCLIDESMGWATMFSGLQNVTAKLQARLRRMAQVGEPLVITCTITKKTKRLVETLSHITLKDGTVIAEGTSTQFVVEPKEEP